LPGTTLATSSPCTSLAKPLCPSTLLLLLLLLLLDVVSILLSTLSTLRERTTLSSTLRERTATATGLLRTHRILRLVVRLTSLWASHLWVVHLVRTTKRRVHARSTTTLHAGLLSTLVHLSLKLSLALLLMLSKGNIDWFVREDMAAHRRDGLGGLLGGGVANETESFTAFGLLNLTHDAA